MSLLMCKAEALEAAWVAAMKEDITSIFLELMEAYAAAKGAAGDA